jgi:putative transposase
VILINKKIHRGVLVKLKPTEDQEQLLKQYVGACRFVYNQALADEIDFYKVSKSFVNYNALASSLTRLKYQPSTRWLKTIESTCLQSSIKNLSQAFRNFISSKKGERKGRIVNFPKFKSKNSAKQSFTMKNNNNNTTIRIQYFSNNTYRLKLPKLGYFKIYNWTRMAQLIGNNKILRVTVTRESNQCWYASVLIEDEIQISDEIGDNVVGIDVGISNSVVLDDGSVATSPKPLEKYLRRLKILQQKLSIKVRFSKNWYKLKRKIGRLHYKIKCIRKDFHHQLSDYIVDNYDIICMETLNIQSMIKNDTKSKGLSKFNRHVLDEGWFQLKTFVKYKCDWRDKQFIDVSKWLPSSKTCSTCGQLVELKLSDRQWMCPTCSTIHDRDQNAAINLRKIADWFKDTGEVLETKDALNIIFKAQGTRVQSV